METIAFCGAIVGVALVIFWYVKSERQGTDRPTTGWFAMRELGRDDWASRAEANVASDESSRRREVSGLAAGGRRSSAARRRR